MLEAVRGVWLMTMPGKGRCSQMMRREKSAEIVLASSAGDEMRAVQYMMAANTYVTVITLPVSPLPPLPPLAFADCVVVAADRRL